MYGFAGCTPEVNRKLPEGIRAWLEAGEAPFAVSMI
jgi:hypothetical protein